MSILASPLSKRLQAVRDAEPGAIVLLRIGDFYESFGADAEFVAKTIGLTITTARRQEESLSMCGFPFHCLDGYLAKLVKAGRRIAVCDPQ